MRTGLFQFWGENAKQLKLAQAKGSKHLSAPPVNPSLQPPSLLDFSGVSGSQVSLPDPSCSGLVCNSCTLIGYQALLRANPHGQEIAGT